VKKSVARPDDGVHSFFARSAERIVGSLMEKAALDDLRKHYGPKHRERRFSLATVLWLGIYAAGHASMKSMESLLKAACDALTGTQLLPLGAKTLTQSGWTRAKERLPLDLLRVLWARWVAIARAQAGQMALLAGHPSLGHKPARWPSSLGITSWPSTSTTAVGTSRPSSANSRTTSTSSTGTPGPSTASG